MTNTNNSNNGSSSNFNFETREQAVALYLDSRLTREAILADLEAHEEYMSRICKGIAETFGTKDEVTGKLSCQLDLGDGSARGHIVVARDRDGQDPLYFIRERNTGRPVGSKNKTSKAKEAAAVAVAAEQPEIVSEGEPVEATSVTTPASPVLSAMEQALAIAEQEEQELAAVAQKSTSNDPVVDAILATQERTLQALKEHVRSTAPLAAAGE